MRSASTSRPPLVGSSLVGGLGNGYNAAFIRQIHHKGVSLHADVDKLVTEPRAYIAYLEESLDKALAAAARADAYAAKLAEQEERMEEMQKSISNLADSQRSSQAYSEQQGNEAGSALAQTVVGLNGLGGRFEAQAATLASVVAAASVSGHQLAEHTARITALEAVAASISADSRALYKGHRELESLIDSNYSSMSKHFEAVELRVQQAENRATDSASDARVSSKNASKSADMAVAAEAAAISARDAMRDAKTYSQTALAAVQSSESETLRAAHIAEAADARVQGAILLILKTLRPTRHEKDMNLNEIYEADAKDFSSLKTLHQDTGSAIATAVARSLESTIEYIRPFDERLQQVEANAKKLKDIVQESSSSVNSDMEVLSRTLTGQMDNLSISLTGQMDTTTSKLRHDMEILGIATKTRMDKCSEGVIEARDRVTAGLSDSRQAIKTLSEDIVTGLNRVSLECSEAVSLTSTTLKDEIERAIEISKAAAQVSLVETKKAVDVSKKSIIDMIDEVKIETTNKVNAVQDESSIALKTIKTWINEELQIRKREESSNILEMKADVMSARAEAKLLIEKVSKESTMFATSIQTETVSAIETLRTEAKSSKTKIEGLIAASAKAAEDALTSARAEIPLQISAMKKKLEDDLSSARAEIPLQIGAMKKKLEEELASARAEIPLQIGAMKKKLETELSEMQIKLNDELQSARSEIPLQIGAMQKRIEVALESSQSHTKEANQKMIEEAINAVAIRTDAGRGSSEETILASVSATASDLCERIEKVATAWARWETRFRNERSVETLSMSNTISLLQRQVREALGLSEDGMEQQVRPAWSDAINEVKKNLENHIEVSEAENQHMLLLADGLVTRWQDTNDTLGALSSEVNAISAVTAAAAVSSNSSGITLEERASGFIPNSSNVTRLSTSELLHHIDAAVQPRAIELMDAHAATLRASLFADLSTAIRAQVSSSIEAIRKKEQESVFEKSKEVEARVEFAISRLVDAEKTILENFSTMSDTIEANSRQMLEEATATATMAVSKAVSNSSNTLTSLAPSIAPLEAILKGAGAPMSPRILSSVTSSATSKLSPARGHIISNPISRSSDSTYPISPRSIPAEKGALDLLERLNASPSASGLAPQSPLTSAASRSTAFSRNLALSSKFAASETRLEKSIITSPRGLMISSSNSSSESDSFIPPRNRRASNATVLQGNAASVSSRRASIASTGSTAARRQVFQARPVDVRLSMGLSSTNVELPDYMEARARELGVYLKTKSEENSPGK
jgi:hypothetical protein